MVKVTPTTTHGVAETERTRADIRNRNARRCSFAKKLPGEETLLFYTRVEGIGQIHEALRRGDAELLRTTIAAHPELKARVNDPLGPFGSPLILAVRTREMLDAAIEAGADLNARSSWWAGSFGLLDTAPDELAHYAISKGARLDIHSAARLGMANAVREFLQRDPAAVHARGGDGQTPLHFARNVEIAELLIARGADLNARDIDHESTPVQWMLDTRREVAAHLIERGAESDIFAAAALGDVALAGRHLEANPACVRLRVNAESFAMKDPRAGGHIYQWTLGFHVSPHEVAAKGGHRAVLELLEARTPKEIELLNGCWAGDRSKVEALLRKNAALAKGLTSAEQKQITHAARNNNTVAVDLMLRAGLPVDARGQHSATPLHWAAWHGNAAMVELLLKANAPTDARDKDYGGDPLRWANHGRENSWLKESGDYPAVISLLEARG